MDLQIQPTAKVYELTNEEMRETKGGKVIDLENVEQRAAIKNDLRPFCDAFIEMILKSNKK